LFGNPPSFWRQQTQKTGNSLENLSPGRRIGGTPKTGGHPHKEKNSGEKLGKGSAPKPKGPANLAPWRIGTSGKRDCRSQKI